MAQPTDFEGANVVMRRPPDMTPDQCADLPVYRGENQIISCWRLDAGELAEISKTGIVWLAVTGGTTPPVLVSGLPLVTINGRPPKPEPILPSPPVTGENQ